MSEDGATAGQAQLSPKDAAFTTAQPRKGSKKTKTCSCSETWSGRNLVVCIDGTSNQFGIKNTNVIELYSLLKKNPENKQLTWYNSGIGTYAKPSWRSWTYIKRVVDHTIDLAIAWNFEDILMDAYRWISETYEPGDCIFLFGFSRGAYQVRALSGMIEKVGLIHRGNEKQIPFAYQLYADPEGEKEPKSSAGPRRRVRLADQLRRTYSQLSSNVSASNRSCNSTESQTRPEDKLRQSPVSTMDDENLPLAQRFKKTFSRESVKVHFVGAWDTVSSIGIARSSSLPLTTDGMRHVCFFRHALALDERRVKFLPEYVLGGSSIPRDITTPLCPPGQSTNTSSQQNSRNSNGAADKLESNLASHFVHTKEVWFAGSHSDIGGGNVDNKALNRSRPPLRWMCFEADALGLRIQPFNRDLKPDEQIQVKESLKGCLYRFLEVLPFKHLTYTDAFTTTRWPHMGERRVIVEHQRVHISLVRAASPAYMPKAQLPQGFPKWVDFKNDDFKHKLIKEGNKLIDFIEVDMYDSFPDKLREYSTLAASNFVRRREIQSSVLSAEGIWVLTQRIKSPDEETMHIVCSVLDICDNIAFGEAHNDLLRTKTAAIDEICEVILDNIAPLLDVTEGSCAEVPQVISSMLCHERLFKTSRERTRIFRSRGDIEPVLTKYINSQVMDVRLSAKKFLGCFTSASVIVLRGHKDFVHSVAFFQDGKRIASASYDQTVRIWDLQTGKMIVVDLHGNHEAFCRVYASHDCKYLASNDKDRSVYIWDTETGHILHNFQSSGGVYDAAFLGRTNLLVYGGFSASNNHISFYDTETQLSRSLDVVEGDTYCHSTSPDGSVIVTGQLDSIHVFKLETRTPQGVGTGLETTLKDAHLKEVFRKTLESDIEEVIFSPDGRYIATVTPASKQIFQLFDVNTGKTVGVSFGTHRGFMSASFFRRDDGKLYLLSAGADDIICVWDAMSGDYIGSRGGFDFWKWVTFSPNGLHVASGSMDDNAISVWEIDVESVIFGGTLS